MRKMHWPDPPPKTPPAHENDESFFPRGCAAASRAIIWTVLGIGVVFALAMLCRSIAWSIRHT